MLPCGYLGMSVRAREPLFSPVEFLPGYVQYALHWPYSIYLALRTWNLFAIALSNPAIFTGGLAGESKKDLHALVGPYGRSFFEPFIALTAGSDAPSIESALKAAGLAYPLVAKPDVGRNGRGVKKVTDLSSLLGHLKRFPPETRMVIQRYADMPGEAGVFYIRRPDEAAGKITSLTLKHFPAVTGDGKSTLRELILKDPRAKAFKEVYFRRNAHDLAIVLPAGAVRPLVTVGNHIRGAVFENGAAHITPEMTAAFDSIAKDIRGFYYGRFDVRYRDLESFKRGEGFSILEYNGASSEPTHVYDRRTTLREMYRDMLFHWGEGWKIGAWHRAHGVKKVSVFTVMKVLWDESRLINSYPDEE